MSTAGQLILIHVVIGFLVVFCVANIRGRMAHLTYEARMATILDGDLHSSRLSSSLTTFTAN